MWLKGRCQPGRSRTSEAGGEYVRVPVFGRLVWPPRGTGQGQTGTGKMRGIQELLGPEAGLRQWEKKRAGEREERQSRVIISRSPRALEGTGKEGRGPKGP